MIRMFEKVKRAEYADMHDDEIEITLGKDHIDDACKLKPTK